DGVAPAAVASLDNLADAWRTVGPHLPAGGSGGGVLVVGDASIGLYAVAIARALGAEVSYVDSEPTRLAIAERLGAVAVERAQAPAAPHALGRFPVTVNTGATVDGLRLALHRTAARGICTNAGIFPGDVAVPLGAMYTRGVTLVTGRAAARRDI